MERHHRQMGRPRPRRRRSQGRPAAVVLNDEKALRTFRSNRKTPEERIRERILRTKLQKEKPSLEDLIDVGECAPDAVLAPNAVNGSVKAGRRRAKSRA